jgi:hypothetical protein
MVVEFSFEAVEAEEISVMEGEIVLLLNENVFVFIFIFYLF